MNDKKTAIAMAFLSSVGDLDTVAAYGLRVGDVIEVGPLGSASNSSMNDGEQNQAIEHSVALAQLLDEEDMAMLCELEALGAGLVHALKVDGEPIPHVPFKLGQSYFIEAIHGPDENGVTPHLDIEVSNGDGERFSLFSGILALKTAKVNGEAPQLVS